MGEPLVFTAKTVKQQGDILLTGQRGSETWKVKFSMQGGRPGAGVGALWARSKIAALMDSLHEGADKQQVRKNVIDVALGHHLVSKYTSLVAVDVTPSRPAGENLKKKAVPTNLPAGWKHHKVFGSLPKTATPAQLNMIIGLVLLLLGYIACNRYLRRAI
jgi:Ca-activated chloride channel family protein